NDEWKTVYLGPIHKNSVFPSDGRKMTLTNIYDGTSNTVMFFEANDDSAVVWSKPDDLIIDVNRPTKGLIRTGQDHFLAAMCDGSVQRFTNTADSKNLVRVIDSQDGEVIDYTKLVAEKPDPKAPKKAGDRP